MAIFKWQWIKGLKQHVRYQGQRTKMKNFEFSGLKR